LTFPESPLLGKMRGKNPLREIGYANLITQGGLLGVVICPIKDMSGIVWETLQKLLATREKAAR